MVWSPCCPRDSQESFPVPQFESISSSSAQPSLWSKVVNVPGGESKVRCCKEQYCIGTWNVWSMNQGKRMWSDSSWQEWTSTFLGNSELKWMRMGEFNSDDHFIYYGGQESLWRNGVALIFNRRVQNAVLGINLKNDRMISICFQGKLFFIK